MDPLQKLHEDTNLALHYQFATGFAFPPVMPFKTKVVAGVAGSSEARSELQEKLRNGLQSLGSTFFQSPVRFRLSSEASTSSFLLPLDPIISIAGKNIITRRYPSKSRRRGSIKERWSQDDYEITISGVLMSDELYDVSYYKKQLRKYLEAAESIDITCEELNDIYDITRISIENYDMPFTKGLENQSFSIKAYSDDLFTLLIES